jgi:hypothetical protein
MCRGLWHRVASAQVADVSGVTALFTQMATPCPCPQEQGVVFAAHPEVRRRPIASSPVTRHCFWNAGLCRETRR